MYRSYRYPTYVGLYQRNYFFHPAVKNGLRDIYETFPRKKGDVHWILNKKFVFNI